MLVRLREPLRDVAGALHTASCIYYFASQLHLLVLHSKSRLDTIHCRKLTRVVGLSRAFNVFLIAVSLRVATQDGGFGKADTTGGGAGSYTMIRYGRDEALRTVQI
jgi:hypothetical protein